MAKSFSGVHNGEYKELSYDEVVKQVANEESGVNFIGMGSAPYMAKLKQGDQVFDYDLREALSNSGFEQTRFEFNPKEMKESESSRLIETNVQANVAYNLARIKNVDQQQQYLKDTTKFESTFKGDDNNWYGMKDGNVYAIDNETGLDRTDAMRLLSGVGSAVVGTIGGVMAGVGAAATAGMALPSVMAMSGAGAVVGEGAQRLVDKAIGADAAKYNAKMGLGEEIKEAGIEFGMGAAGGAIGQLGSAGIAKAGIAFSKAKGAVLPKIGVGTEEFYANQVAKKEMGYLEQQLPPSWKQKYASAEEASAMDAINAGKQAKSPEEMKSSLADAKNALGKSISPEEQQLLAPGSTKPSQMFNNEAEEAGWQKQAREQWKADEANKAELKQQQIIKDAKRNDEILAKKPELKGTMDNLAIDVYSESPELVKTILSKDSTVQAHEAAKEKLTNNFVGSLKEKGVKIQYDEITGQPKGIDPISLAQKNKEITANIFQEANDFTLQTHEQLTLNAWPQTLDAAQVKAVTSKQITELMGNTDNVAVKEQLSRILKTVKDHERSNAVKTMNNFNDFHTVAYNQMETLSAGDSAILKKAQESVMNYERNFVDNPKLFDNFADQRTKLLDLRLSTKRGTFDKDFKPFLDRTQELERSISENASPYTEELAELNHANDVFQNKDKSVYRGLLNPETMDKHDAFMYLTKVNTSQGKKYAEATAEKKGKGLMTAAAAGLGVKLLGGSTSEALMTAVTAASKGELIEGGKVASALATAKAVASKSKEVVGFTAPKALGRATAAFSAEEYISSKRLKEHKETQAEFRRKQKEKAASGER